MYLTNDDIKNQLRDQRLTQIIDGNQDIVEDAIRTAIAFATDALAPRYDTEAIFALVDNDRHPQVVWWIICMATFYIYQRVPDKQIPQRVIDNYNETKSALEMIEREERNSTLPLKMNGTTATEGHKFRWGSETRRTV